MNPLVKTLLKMKKNSIATDVNCTFSKLTTLGTGGTIFLTVYPESAKQLVFVARYLVRHKIRHCYLGMGSNILASDEPFCGVVVVTTRVKETAIDGNFVTASCGVSTSKLCAELVKHGLTGGEFFGCLPATVGGAVVCNAGCFGQCAADVVESVTVLHKTKVKTLPNSRCNFAKRQSLFKNNDEYVVLLVKMRFAKADPKEVESLLKRMRDAKSAAQPLGVRSAGCVLYNEEVSVSKLIDAAGLKGFRIGGAEVSQKHAGFVINVDKATSSDIYLLINYLKRTLSEKFGVSAQTELCLVNFS